MNIESVNIAARLGLAADRCNVKAHVLEIMRYAQVEMMNLDILGEIARDMKEAVDAIFGPLSSIAVLTESARRQVWFAVLAKLEVEQRIAPIHDDQAARAQVLTQLLTARNTDLVTWAYGSCPPGFLSLVTRAGERARTAQFYRDLHDFLRFHPELAAPLQATTKGQALPDDAVDILKRFPRTPLGVKAAARFDMSADLDRFLRAYQAITGTDQIHEAHLRRLASGETPSHMVEKLYLDIPFPAPLLTTPAVRFVRNGQELVHVAKENANCLANYVAQAQSGLVQYYTWTGSTGTTVIFSITREPLFGFYLSECRLPGNKLVPPETQSELRLLLKDHGVTRSRSVESLVSCFHELRGETDDFGHFAYMPDD